MVMQGRPQELGHQGKHRLIVMNDVYLWAQMLLVLLAMGGCGVESDYLQG